jgi:hypothetical protein
MLAANQQTRVKALGAFDAETQPLEVAAIKAQNAHLPLAATVEAIL